MARFAAALALSGCAALPVAPPLSSRAAGEAFRDCPDCPEMVVIPPGRFVMGTADEETDRWEGGRESPRHTVTIPYPFAIGRYEPSGPGRAGVEGRGNRVAA
ncbi:MAG: SUMF1/EgtB/PvdO family nonheme iron enzyme [Burkholderiales bacterium]|nr:SUMF1/EgtB/PvdO family nonheme iron enzyme [Burkholderiales bacterium]